jgi:pimeloyl-ACP methyl ester carboxylesterase
MDPLRRKILKTGAAATAMAAAQRVFAQQTRQGGAAMSFYEKGPVRIHYEEAGSGFPLLLIAGGGLNSTISGLNNPFDSIQEFKGEYRCIASDLRNANAGQSSGPLEIDRPWDAYTDDHLGVMDHLGIDKFMVMGFCIGGPLVWNLIERAPTRVVAAVLAQPSGSRPEARDQCRPPAGHAAVVKDGGHLRPEPDGLGRHGRDNAIGRTSQEVPDEGAANAEAQHHELVDAQVIHQTEMVIGV